MNVSDSEETGPISPKFDGQSDLTGRKDNLQNDSESAGDLKMQQPDNDPSIRDTLQSDNVDYQAKQPSVEENQARTANEEIMDSEVSSISREETSSVDMEKEAIKTNSLEESEDKNLGYRTPTCRISSDFEMAALSPCFPLIKDKEEAETDSNLVKIETSDLNISSLDNSPPKEEIIPPEERPVNTLVATTENELCIKSEPSDESKLTTETLNNSFQQNEKCLENENIARGQIDAGDKEKEVKIKDENGSKDLNIVSSSLDKTDFPLDDKKDVWSVLKDVCDSSRDEPLETSDQPKCLSELDIGNTNEESELDIGNTNEEKKKEEIKDEDGDMDSLEDLANVSFVSSVEEEDEPEPIPYKIITDNSYLVDKKKTRLNKEIRRIRCDCVYEPDEPGFVGCGANCLNRLLMIECGNKCGCGEFCTNKSFQRGLQYDLEVFRAGKKGWGLRANERIDGGVFVIEYCGEVVNYSEFMKRTSVYDDEKRKHYYFMLLKGDEVIDATRAGSVSRFINHSCDPNCVTQKWTVNGFLRVGFFSLREIKAGEELCFDYQYQRYGEKAQKCFCGAVNCRGVIGTKNQVILKPFDKGSNGESSRKKSKKKNVPYTPDCSLEDELSNLLGDQNQIATSKQALELTRLMVKADTSDDRSTLLKILRDQSDFKALKAFIRYKGLSLLWSWMVDTPKKSQSFRAEVLNTLKILPIPNKNFLVDSKILPLVEKWSAFHDSPDSGSRSDEDGSSSENEAGSGDAKKEPGSNKKSKTDPKVKGETKNGSGDEESDNPEKMEEVGSMANELLDRWKLLREVFKIPKKTQLTPELPKQGLGLGLDTSLVEEKRTWKRKLEGDKPQAFSPSKRQYGSPFSQRSNSPLRPLMQETPSIPFLTNSPSSSSASPQPKASKNTNDGDQSTTTSAAEAEKDDLIHRIMQISEKSIDSPHVTPPPPRRSIEPRNVEEDLRSLRGRGRFARGGSSLSWRNTPQLQEDFNTNAGGNLRGHRGGRGKFRGRGRGNFNQFGQQQQQQLYGETNVNDRQQTPVNLPAFNVVDTEQNKNAQYADGSYGLQRPTPFGDNSRMGGSPYNYQAVSQGVNRNLAPEYIPQDNMHLERQQQQQQQNIHVAESRQQNFDQRFSPMRHNSPSANRFGKPVQDWQNQGQGLAYSAYSGQAQRSFSPARMPPNMNSPIPPSAPPPQFTSPPTSGHNIPNQSLPPSQALPNQNLPNQNLHNQHMPSQNVPNQNMPLWNQTWPATSQQNYQPQNLVPPNIPNRNVSPHGIRGGVPNLTNTNPAPMAPYPYHHERLPGQQVLQQQQLHQRQPFYDNRRQTPYGQPQHTPEANTMPAQQSDQSQSTPASIIKHLHELAQQSKIAAAQHQSKQQVDQVSGYGQGTPETAPESGISYVTPVKEARNLPSNAESPVNAKPIGSLPPNWKTATDPEGKIYYYHILTRETQWELPKMEPEAVAQQPVIQNQQLASQSGPRTPPASPPHSPISPARFSQRPPAISDPSVSTSRLSNASVGPSEQLTPKQQKIRDHFKMKLSGVVVNCLNPYQKVDCKQARIAKIDDFKFLARKLTHGLMMKELSRVKSDEELECNDSVKIKVKEYIRNYMRKFGEFYIRS